MVDPIDEDLASSRLKKHMNRYQAIMEYYEAEENRMANQPGRLGSRKVSRNPVVNASIGHQLNKI